MLFLYFRDHFIILVDTPSIKDKEDIIIFVNEDDDILCIEGAYSRGNVEGELLQVAYPLITGRFKYKIQLPGR